MHDVFEGVCHFDLCLILNYYIETVNLFNIDTLNDRNNLFNYGPVDINNMSNNIKLDHIRKKSPKNDCIRNDDLCLLPSLIDR